MAESKLVTVPDLGLPMSEKTPEAESRPVTLREARQMAERGVILEALAEAEGNISQAAKRLGVSRPTFYDLIKAYGIRV
ncbi:MAG TPA: helix-turn-helix domain-containing protein, partial [Alphaproteobacteria bacterium]|nr:helix-turn-helix domain-containing protein [Alphaproteobacteria bacterium]